MALLAATAALASACTTTRGGGAVALDSGPAPGARFDSDEDFRTWFTFYYKHPRPDRVTPAIEFMDRAGYLETQPEIAAVFLSELIHRQPDQLLTWAKEWERLQPKAWNVILVSLWFSGDKGAAAIFKENAGRATGPFKERVQAVLAGEAPALDVLKMDVSDPRHINLIWSAFSASGDPKFVQKVIRYVKLYGNEENPDANAIGETALMTLATNVPLHDVVASVCTEENRRNPDEKTRALLDTMFQILAQIANDGAGRQAH